MEPPFTSTFILKLFLVSLFGIATNAKPTNNTKPVSIICPKTKNPEQCFKIMDNEHTRFASSLVGLGLGTLDLAKLQARSSANVFNTILHTRKDLRWSEKTPYQDCRHNYMVAMGKLGEAQTAWIERKYVLARKSIEVSYKVPSSCAKVLVGAPISVIQVRKANEISDITFEISLVIVKELEHGRN